MIELKNIKLSYTYKKVLQDVNIKIQDGQIYSLLGENGAGKSSLAKVISGLVKADSGQIFVNNNFVKIEQPKDALKQGIFYVQQTPLLAKSISIKENIQLGYDSGKLADSIILEYIKYWLGDLNPKTLVQDLDSSQRFFVSLISCLIHKPSVLILDEPGALLDVEQRKFLFENLKNLAKKGICILFITHNLQEAVNQSDWVILLKEGEIEKVAKGCDITQEGIVNDLYSQSNFDINAPVVNNKTNKCLKFADITSRPINKAAIFNVSFKAEQGKITLISGHKESGIQTLEDVVTFIEKSSVTGIINYDGKNINLKKATNLRQSLKIGVIPSDRNFRASNPNFTVLQLLTVYKKYFSLKKLTEHANRLVAKADVQIKLSEKVSCLSGGMLQRLLLQREISENPDIFIFCEPLQGLDFKSSCNTIKLISELKSEGKIIIVISSTDFPNQLADYYYQMQGGYCKLGK